MTNKFLITGLPRSRTAWMAELCTTTHSICYHEPIKNMKRWQEVYELWEHPGYVGVSDSSMGFHLGEILDRAAPRTLIILRDLYEVENSLRNQGLPALPAYCHVLQNRLYALIEHPLVRTVRFEELNVVGSVELCLEHLVPGLRVDLNRLDRLMDTNIQVDVNEIKGGFKDTLPDLEALLGADVMREITTYV